MDNKDIIIIILVVALVVIVAGGLYFLSIPATNETNITNNSLENSNKDTQVSTSSSNSDDSAKSSSSQKKYDDWQKDYETGEYDEDGNPIYRSVISTSGGQSEPGIYESYWSASGPISEKRIG